MYIRIYIYNLSTLIKFPSSLCIYIYIAQVSLYFDENSLSYVGGTLILKCEYSYSSDSNEETYIIKIDENDNEETFPPDSQKYQFGSNCCSLDDNQTVYTVRIRDLQLNLNGTAFKCGSLNERNFIWSNIVIVSLLSGIYTYKHPCIQLSFIYEFIHI